MFITIGYLCDFVLQMIKKDDITSPSASLEGFATAGFGLRHVLPEKLHHVVCHQEAAPEALPEKGDCHGEDSQLVERLGSAEARDRRP
ncbi:hypothetical protein, partial [Gordonibacter sp. An230]|uniref:hypothetical protein n=1 Tax=Gordonibacter sp. An230 TaxID=1965592 RepID=UPI001951C7A0